MLSAFIEVNQVKAQLLAAKEELATLAKLAHSLGFSQDVLAKTFLFVDEKGKEGVLAVIEFSAEPSIEKLEDLTGIIGLREATNTEALEITGFEQKLIPPVSVYGVPTFLSKKLSEKKEIVTAAGDHLHVLKISVEQIKEHGYDVKEEDVVE